MPERIFPKRYMTKLNDLAEGFTDAVDQSDLEDIKKRILAAENNIHTVEQDKETNEKLLKAKEELKEMTAPYRETKSVEMAKIKYCFYVLENRGQKV